MLLVVLLLLFWAAAASVEEVRRGALSNVFVLIYTTTNSDYWTQASAHMQAYLGSFGAVGYIMVRLPRPQPSSNR
jgi:hypothetical protein